MPHLTHACRKRGRSACRTLLCSTRWAPSSLRQWCQRGWGAPSRCGAAEARARALILLALQLVGMPRVWVPTHCLGMQGHLEAGLLYTASYLRNMKAVLRGALRGVAEPVNLPSLIKVRGGKRWGTQRCSGARCAIRPAALASGAWPRARCLGRRQQLRDGKPGGRAGEGGCGSGRDARRWHAVHAGLLLVRPALCRGCVLLPEWMDWL